MRGHFWSFAAWAAAAPFVQAAQAKNPLPDPADSIDVPATRYESVFSSYRGAANEATTPDAGWRGANDEVRALGGHAGHIAAEAPEAGKKTAKATAKPLSRDSDGSGVPDAGKPQSNGVRQ